MQAVNKNNRPIRHGEVMLVPVNEIPTSGVANKHTEFIVGHSETGHHHVLESKAKFDVVTEGEKQALYIRLFEPAKLVHKKTVDKHKTLTVAPGAYRVVQKTEYNPWEQIISRVFD